MPHIKSGALDTISPNRVVNGPQKCPMYQPSHELGYPNTEAETFVAILAPAGTLTATYY
jgi:hypothetical protein